MTQFQSFGEFADKLTAQRDDELGRAAYEGYCEARLWKSITGEPLPRWSDQQWATVKTAWIGAAKAVLRHDLENG